MENSRKNAAKNSALNYLDAVEKYIMYHDVDSEKYPYDLKDNTWNIVDTTKEISLLNLIPSVKAEEVEVPPLNDFIKVNGSKPTSGTITISSKGKITNAEMVILNYNITCDSSTSCSVEGKLENEKETKITNIVLSEDATIEEGDSHEFTAAIEPSDANTNTITWCSSSDTIISGATEQGRCETGEYEITACYGNTSCEVEGTSEGKTTIIARVNDVNDSAILDVEKAKLWLYKDGKVNPITGGFTSSNLYWTDTNGIPVDNDYYLFMDSTTSSSSDDRPCFVTTNNKIDVSNYSKIYVEGILKDINLGRNNYGVSVETGISNGLNYVNRNTDTIIVQYYYEKSNTYTGKITARYNSSGWIERNENKDFSLPTKDTRFIMVFDSSVIGKDMTTLGNQVYISFGVRGDTSSSISAEIYKVWLE